jgi:RNA polymerase-binding transcription factor DksA
VKTVKELIEEKIKLEERIRHLEKDLKTPRSTDPDEDAVEAKNREIIYSLYNVEKLNLARLEAEMRNIG